MTVRDIENILFNPNQLRQRWAINLHLYEKEIKKHKHSLKNDVIPTNLGF